MDYDACLQTSAVCVRVWVLDSDLLGYFLGALALYVGLGYAVKLAAMIKNFLWPF